MALGLDRHSGAPSASISDNIGLAKLPSTASATQLSRPQLGHPSGIRPRSAHLSAYPKSTIAHTVNAVVNIKTAPTTPDLPTNFVRPAKKTPTVPVSSSTAATHLRKSRHSRGVGGDFEVVTKACLKPSPSLPISSPPPLQAPLSPDMSILSSA
jgi:hypothetical protein